jgi:hypothetical protein
LFNTDNAAAVFRTFDPSTRGWISLDQYNTGTSQRG